VSLSAAGKRAILTRRAEKLAVPKGFEPLAFGLGNPLFRLKFNDLMQKIMSNDTMDFSGLRASFLRVFRAANAMQDAAQDALLRQPIDTSTEGVGERRRHQSCARRETQWCPLSPNSVRMN
jgi:hypothetical protein